MPSTDDLLQDLRAEIAAGRALAIIGTGVSIGATKGHPHASWTGLIESGVERCLAVFHSLPDDWEERVRKHIHSGNLDDLLAAAEEVSRRLGAPDGGEFRRWLRETVGTLTLQDRTVLEALQDLRVPLATTNYDGLLEEVTGLQPVTWRDRGNVERVLRGEQAGIVHLHGYWKEPESVVLGIHSYDEISGDPHAKAMLQALRSLRTLLFVGCGEGLADPNFGALLRWSREVFNASEARHFRLCRTGEVVQVQAMHPPEERIFALPYGPEHKDLGPFLRSLAVAHQGEPRGMPERDEIVHHLRDLSSRIEHELREMTYLPLASREIPPGPLVHAKEQDPFVAPIHQVLLELVGRAHGGDSASAQIAAVNRRSRTVRNILRTLDRSPDPLILLGEPGSGKTMTLQQAAMTLARRESQRRFPRAVLYVRLGEFHVEKEGRISAEDVLRFVEQASPLGLRSSISRLAEAGRLVIFFDGMDEMSRDCYGDHTEALSRFASRTPSKTLFSCRITDFSPRFIHRRLVLLPFDRSQVAKYLRRYILSGFPLEIDGQPWTLKALARRITQGDLPVQADNPFVLWLLCLYLQEQRKWPASRVELLRFYSETNYRRKQAELAEDEPPFPPMQEVFEEWARFAYQITERNRGVAIPVRLLAAGRDEAEVREIIRIGKRCGILAESREGHEHFVRFEHHRFQEYFAACYLHATRAEIDWTEHLDAPRWQETMLNLILLGDRRAAQALADSIVGLTETCRTVPIREEPKDVLPFWRRRDARDEPPPLNDENEILLADRVELFSRILCQGSEALSDSLISPFREAVHLLAQRGNPITQVKMMRVCLNVPRFNSLEILRKPLHSPILWVRNQALILLAGKRAGERAAGSDFATEMGYDLANGMFPVSLTTYVNAVRKAADPDHDKTLVKGSISFFLSLLLLFSLTGSIYYGAWSLRTVSVDLNSLSEKAGHAVASWPWQRWQSRLPAQAPNTEASHVAPIKNERLPFRALEALARPGFVAIFLVLVLLTAWLTLAVEPSFLWAAVTGISIVFVVLGPLFLTLWQGSHELFSALALSSPLWLPALFFAGLVAAAIHFGSLAVFLAATTRSRHPGHSVRSFLATGWRSCGFQYLLSEQCLGISWGLLLLLLLLSVFLFVVLTVDYLLRLPYDLAVSAFLIAGSLGMIFFLGRLAWVFLRMPAKQALRVVGGDFLGSLAGLMGFALFICFVVYVVPWSVQHPTANVFRSFVIISAALIFLALLVERWRSMIHLRRFRTKKDAMDATMTPHAWELAFRVLPSDAQSFLLLHTDHQALSLTPAEFLEVLRKVRPLIKEEPALSTYWDRRDQLEQMLRQDRYDNAAAPSNHP